MVQQKNVDENLSQRGDGRRIIMKPWNFSRRFPITGSRTIRTRSFSVRETTNKKFRLEFCTVAHWKNGEITEERLFYDLVGMMRQLGLA